MKIRVRVKKWLAAKAQARLTGQEHLDLALFKRKPSSKMLCGLSLMGLSYVTCWPVISILSIVALRLHDHLIFSVGSPVAYIFSHCLFIAGTVLIGTEGMKYSQVFFRWAAHIVCKKILGDCYLTPVVSESELGAEEAEPRE